MKKPSFVSSKLGSDVPKNGKIPRFVRVGFRVLKNRKILKIRSGGLPKNENPKICLGGLLKNENPKIKIRKCGRLSINKNSKIKIRFSFSWIGFDFGLWAFDSIGCDILGLWICIGCDISLAGFGSVS
ncbi:unnamed protein product [Rhizophagus irregularis]|nr:unnamed protein product [Rhizophagus irregularis]